MVKRKIKPRKGKGLLPWRSRQKRGAIMKPTTFEAIVKNCMKVRGYSRKRCETIAGKAYWSTVKSKYKKSKV